MLSGRSRWGNTASPHAGHPQPVPGLLRARLGTALLLLPWGTPSAQLTPGSPTPALKQDPRVLPALPPLGTSCLHEGLCPHVRLPRCRGTSWPCTPYPCIPWGSRRGDAASTARLTARTPGSSSGSTSAVMSLAASPASLGERTGTEICQ